MSNVELNCGGKKEEKLEICEIKQQKKPKQTKREIKIDNGSMKLSGYRLLALWSTDGRGSRTLSPECTCNLKSQCVSAMCLKALPALSLSLCCLLGNPSLGQSQQGNSNRERKKSAL